jgi:aspartokinase/homoserine dehydrogenase 1
MQSCTSADEYMQKLPSFDQDWASERNDAEAAGEVSILSHFFSWKDHQ